MAPSKKAIFYPTADTDVTSYYSNLISQLTAVQAKYSIDSNLLNKLATYNNQIPAAINKAAADQEAAKTSTLTKNELLALARKEALRELNRITELDGFEESDAMALGIRRGTAPLDTNTVKPIITNVTVLPDQVIIDWIKGSMEGVVISVSEDGVAFADLTTDLRSPYEDRRKNKAAEPEARYYRLRYLYKDQQVGLYSEVMKVAVVIQ